MGKLSARKKRVKQRVKIGDGGGPQNSESVLSWTPTSIGRTRSHVRSTEFLC